MAPIEKKRSRNGAGQKAGKRQRIALDDQETAGLGPRSLDALPWNEVALPARLEDAEGFFGLEEVSDIEIVRNSGIGKVEYRLSTTKTAKKPHKKPSKEFEGRQSTVDDSKISPNLGQEVWEGFEVTEGSQEESQNATKALDARPSSKATRKGANIVQRRQNQMVDKQPKDDVPPTSASNPFDALDETTEEEADVSAWQSLGLSSETLSSLARLRFSSPTPIQAFAIPDILIGHDVIGKASTGSGKTLAFGIPILEHYLKTRDENGHDWPKISEDRKHSPTALILSPTRELAYQLSAHLSDLCSKALTTGPVIATITGGLSVQKQQRQLANADIVIGTPGRLWEVIGGNHDLASWFKKTKYLVVDEADRLLSEGHFKEVEEILNAVDRPDPDLKDSLEHESENDISNLQIQRQTLVFSATFQKELQQKLAGKSKSTGGELMGKQESMEYLLKKLNFREEKPKFVDVNPMSQMASGLKEGIVECAGLDKDLYLYALLLHHPHTRTLIFTNSITSVRRLSPFLQNLNIPAHSLHSQMPQKARLRSIERFSSPSSPGSILIATDVAARGLDIPSVQLVIHYHVPRAADMYVHRSGRTARAEKQGSSILLCAPEEVLGVRRLVAKVHARNTSTASGNRSFFIRTIELDRRILARLKPRVVLSKKISDASLAKEKKGHEDNWLRTAAEDLGVEYDSEDFAAGEASKKGRGQGRKRAEKEARALSKAEVGALRGELKEMLAQRVNVGVSEKYLTAGGVDVDELLEGQRGEFLGRMDGAGDW